MTEYERGSIALPLLFDTSERTPAFNSTASINTEQNLTLVSRNLYEEMAAAISVNCF